MSIYARTFRISFALLILILARGALAAAPSVTAVLSDSQPAVGQMVQLEIKVNGANSANVPETISIDGLEIHQRHGGEHFVANVEGEIALPVQHTIDLGLILGKINLGLQRGTLGTLGQGFGDAVIDRVLHHFRHGGTAIDLLEVRGGNLAGTEALEGRLAPDLIELGVKLGHEGVTDTNAARWCMRT